MFRRTSQPISAASKRVSASQIPQAIRTARELSTVNATHGTKDDPGSQRWIASAVAFGGGATALAWNGREKQAAQCEGLFGGKKTPLKNKISKGGADMTNAIIDAFKDDKDFLAASALKLQQLKTRDKDDGIKLQEGIDLAIEKKVLPANVKVEDVIKVNVTGKSPADVAAEIKSRLPNEACVLTIQGLSGLGKGTTVEMLKGMLSKSATWSNGNIFRSITLLATRYAIKEKFSQEEKDKYKGTKILTTLKAAEDEKEQALKKEFDARIKALLTPQNVLTADNLKMFFTCLSFDKFKGGALDTQIKSDLLPESPLLVKEVENTVLKTISPFIPAVANVTQGEVIGFIQMALAKLTANGDTVLLEGREQTLNYIRTPYRFELVIDDESVLGKRQAALMMGAEVKKMVEKLPDDAAVMNALKDELKKLDK